MDKQKDIGRKKQQTLSSIIFNALIIINRKYLIFHKKHLNVK